MPTQAWEHGLGVPPLGGPAPKPPKGRTPNRILKRALRTFCSSPVYRAVARRRGAREGRQDNSQPRTPASPQTHHPMPVGGEPSAILPSAICHFQQFGQPRTGLSSCKPSFIPVQNEQNHRCAPCSFKTANLPIIRCIAVVTLRRHNVNSTRSHGENISSLKTSEWFPKRETSLLKGFTGMFVFPARLNFSIAGSCATADSRSSAPISFSAMDALTIQRQFVGRATLCMSREPLKAS